MHITIIGGIALGDLVIGTHEDMLPSGGLLIAEASVIIELSGG